MLSGLGLKDRESFMDVYLNPSIKGKFVRLLYPNSPRHPRQKYLLTVKGLALYNEHIWKLTFFKNIAHSTKIPRHPSSSVEDGRAAVAIPSPR